MCRTVDIYIYGETFCKSKSTSSWSKENEKYLYGQLGLLTEGFLDVYLTSIRCYDLHLWRNLFKNNV